MDSEVNEATERPVPTQGQEENGDESSKTAGGSITETYVLSFSCSGSNSNLEIRLFPLLF